MIISDYKQLDDARTETGGDEAPSSVADRPAAELKGNGIWEAPGESRPAEVSADKEGVKGRSWSHAHETPTDR